MTANQLEKRLSGLEKQFSQQHGEPEPSLTREQIARMTPQEMLMEIRRQLKKPVPRVDLNSPEAKAAREFVERDPEGAKRHLEAMLNREE